MMRLVVFHMTGCPYCKSVTGPDSATKSLGDLVPVYEVERTDPLAQKMGVSSFPTIYLSTPLITYKYEGPRTPEDLRRFTLEKMGQSLLLANFLKRASERA
jgi:hypothetical protein